MKFAFVFCLFVCLFVFVFVVLFKLENLGLSPALQRQVFHDMKISDRSTIT